MDFNDLIDRVAEGRELAPVEAQGAATALASPSVAAAEKERFLELLARRGETPGEVAGFAQAFRTMARNPGLERWAATAIDVCGTGGDRSGTFNISTTVAFALAASGVPVIKHGNRSITSQCGSADLLEALGFRLDLGGDALRDTLGETGFVFLFAPAHHPAFKEIAPVRKALAARGVRTFFNLLGPLLNPARPAHQIVGVFGEAATTVVAQALDALGLAGGFAVHGRDAAGQGYDELTTCGPNLLEGFGALREERRTFSPEELDLATGPARELAGGDLKANLAILDDVLAGRAPRTLVDTITLNIAAGLHAVGRAPSLRAGLEPARATLTGGATREWLERARARHRA